MSRSTPVDGPKPNPCDICREPAVEKTTICENCMPVIVCLKRFVHYPMGRKVLRLALNRFNRERRNVGEASVHEL